MSSLFIHSISKKLEKGKMMYTEQYNPYMAKSFSRFVVFSYSHFLMNMSLTAAGAEVVVHNDNNY